MNEIPERINLPVIQEVYDNIVLHTNEKYDDVFTFRQTVNQRFGALYVRITMNSEKFPDKKIYGFCFRDDEGNVCITDNYVGVKYENEVRDVLRNIISDLYGSDTSVDYEACSTISNLSFDDETTLEQFLASKGACISFNAFVFLPKDGFNREKEEEAIKNKLISSGICCSGTIYFTENKNLISEAPETDSLGLLLKSHPYFDYCEFIMNNDGVFDYFGWEALNG